MRTAGWTPRESDLDLLDMAHEVVTVKTPTTLVETAALMWKAFDVGRRYADHKRYEEEHP